MEQALYSPSDGPAVARLKGEERGPLMGGGGGAVLLMECV